jgi:hypothetical protein
MVRNCGKVCAVLALGGLALGTAWADPITVGFVQQDSTIASVGGTVQVDIVADIPESTPIAGWGLDLTIVTPAIAALTGQTIGPAWDAVTYTPDGDLLAGLAPTPPGVGIWGNEVILATLTFTGLAPGTTPIVLSDSNPPDQTEGFAIYPLENRSFAEVTYVDGSITVLPEPASLALLAVALLLRRR